VVEPNHTEFLYQLTLSAARMLLITRGVEPRSEEDVFRQFHQHFLDTGLVDAGFHALIEVAHKKDLPAILLRSSEVLQLAGALEELCGQMDNSLRFPGEIAKPAAKIEADQSSMAVISRDLRGVPCPMNFVKTKLALEELAPGKRLKVMLDDGAPIENVPRSVSAEGHKFLAQTKEGGYWTVLIEKGPP
jgi:sulfite reductase (ferredoxin)